MPVTTSSFSWPSRRSASLIATSALDWLSAETPTTGRPSTPPISLNNSIASSPPWNSGTEPAPAKGPERSVRMPMRSGSPPLAGVVCARACAGTVAARPIPAPACNSDRRGVMSLDMS